LRFELKGGGNSNLALTVTGAGFSESQSVIDDSLCATTLNLIEVKIRSLNVRFGSKADIAALQPMSALPPKADIGTQWWVRFVPKADIRGLYRLVALGH
jgi:hypothetical protein